jgi:hypothetical protein
VYEARSLVREIERMEQQWMKCTPRQFLEPLLSFETMKQSLLTILNGLTCTTILALDTFKEKNHWPKLWKSLGLNGTYVEVGCGYGDFLWHVYDSKCFTKLYV